MHDEQPEFAAMAFGNSVGAAKCTCALLQSGVLKAGAFNGLLIAERDRLWLKVHFRAVAKELLDEYASKILP